MKHTHKGTCQVCGRVQAYNGLIAKHGYTVDYGFFNGVCRGSDRPPLQLEKKLAEEYVEVYQNGADSRAKLVREHRDGTNPVLKGNFNRREGRGYAAKRIEKTLTVEEYVGSEFDGWAAKDWIEPEVRVEYATKAFAEQVERDVNATERASELWAKAAKEQAERIEAVFGTDLIPNEAPKVETADDYEVGQTFEHKNRVWTLIEYKEIKYRDGSVAKGFRCEYKAPRSTGTDFLTLRQLKTRMKG